MILSSYSAHRSILAWQAILLGFYLSRGHTPCMVHTCTARDLSFPEIRSPRGRDFLVQPSRSCYLGLKHASIDSVQVWTTAEIMLTLLSGNSWHIMLTKWQGHIQGQGEMINMYDGLVGEGTRRNCMGMRQSRKGKGGEKLSRHGHQYSEPRLQLRPTIKGGKHCSTV
jgi:hypothetical protein